LYYV